MSDRHAGYLVVLAEDIRDDDAEHVLNALRMVSGVVAVTPVIADFAQVIARERRDDMWREALRNLSRNGPEVTSGGTH